MNLHSPSSAGRIDRARSTLSAPGFTLIELLTAIAILSVLASLIFAVSHTALKQSYKTRCLSDLRQIGTAIHIFKEDNRGRLPSISHQRTTDGSSLSWTLTLRTYLGNDFLGRCPCVPDHPAKITYGWNDLAAQPSGRGLNFDNCRTPSETMVVAELAPTQSSEHLHFRGAGRGRVTPALFKSFVNVECHGSSANYLFLDGHVASLTWAEVQAKLKTNQPSFLFP